jgi:hypothetical protein
MASLNILRSDISIENLINNRIFSENEKSIIKSIQDNDYNKFVNLINLLIVFEKTIIMHFACKTQNRLEFVKYLFLKRDFDVNNRICYFTFLENAVEHMNFDVIRFLVQKGAYIIENVDEFLYTYSFSKIEKNIVKNIMNENYFVKPCKK